METGLNEITKVYITYRPFPRVSVFLGPLIHYLPVLQVDHVSHVSLEVVKCMNPQPLTSQQNLAVFYVL